MSPLYKLVFIVTVQEGRACTLLACGWHYFVLYTGDNMFERVSPRVIVLDPPEKLVIETRASGGYGDFDWQRNRDRFSATIQEFSNFFEIFVREPTTADDLGVYEVELGVGTGPQLPEIRFDVTPYSEYVYVTVCV